MRELIQFNRESIKDKQYIMRQKILRSILNLLNYKQADTYNLTFVDNN